jgi:hypothetical protein
MFRVQSSTLRLRKKTGKTMEQLTEEKRKEVREYEKNWGNEHTKQRTNQILP